MNTNIRPVPINRLTGGIEWTNEEVMRKVKHAIEKEQAHKEIRKKYDAKYVVGLKPIPIKKLLELKMMKRWTDNTLAYDNYMRLIKGKHHE